MTSVNREHSEYKKFVVTAKVLLVSLFLYLLSRLLWSFQFPLLGFVVFQMQKRSAKAGRTHTHQENKEANASTNSQAALDIAIMYKPNNKFVHGLLLIIVCLFGLVSVRCCFCCFYVCMYVCMYRLKRKIFEGQPHGTLYTMTGIRSFVHRFHCFIIVVVVVVVIDDDDDDVDGGSDARQFLWDYIKREHLEQSNGSQVTLLVNPFTFSVSFVSLQSHAE